ncbi:hypothetical protein MMC18_009601 [Xylographa bjoerkii]|nr:hypothetical protein [Xylographa bjoerkii]MCJ1396709.1 hypothetical protein [Xylographa bjoerkii]
MESNSKPFRQTLIATIATINHLIRAKPLYELGINPEKLATIVEQPKYRLTICAVYVPTDEGGFRDNKRKPYDKARKRPWHGGQLIININRVNKRVKDADEGVDASRGREGGDFGRRG